MTTLGPTNIATETDDGQAGSGAGYHSSGAAIVIGGYFGTANAWFRFPSLGIGKDSSFSAATITLNIVTRAGSGAAIRWYGVKEASPTYPTSDADYNGRTLTTAFVDQNTTSGTGTFVSSDLSAIFTELAAQASFGTGSSIMIFAKDNGSNTLYGGFENRIMITGYTAGSLFAQLNGTYTAGATGGTSKNLLTLGVG